MTLARLFRRGVRLVTTWVGSLISLTGAAMQRIRRGPTARLVAAAVLVLAVATGAVEALASSVSGVEILVLGVAVFVALTVLSARRSPESFRSATLCAERAAQAMSR